ncbi:L-threonylcarbamoyladenylate synthase [Acetobacteraceae bacterium KSS8]|uniref:Threonylcarbamoyl-AMP synthase n=1 Tax=Endosaccharibacter trunci TaxID=2812733 RepID=A0ABT1W2I0_9PROT|nr:L-threonylcarbamoyladenylate synthase [Acetobacteraceae bacterium KSS8]
MHQPMPQGAAQTGLVATELLQPGAAGVERAAGLLRAGLLVAFGTETVYGLGADATDPRAVAAIFAAKGRPAHNPLIVHVADAETAGRIVRLDDRARALAAAFWPGPLTLVLPKAEPSPVSALAAAGLETLAVRVPGSSAALDLLRATGRPVAAPSANRSGSVSPTTARHVLDGLGGRIDAVLDTGPCRVGLESTILDLSAPEARLLRPGGIARAAIEGVIGPVRAETTATDTPNAPGQFASHYAPGLPVRLAAGTVGDDEALLAFGSPLAGAALTFQLSERGDPDEAAATLFAGLRALDQDGQRLGLRAIAVMPIPERGIGEAIADRLRRAAAPRFPLDAEPSR